ncbi:MAG: WG repeat-containing protein [Cyanobacteriota bacterium]|mgnify:CR=1 FL=1
MLKNVKILFILFFLIFTSKVVKSDEFQKMSVAVRYTYGPLPYKYADFIFKEGLAPIIVNKKYGFIDKLANVVIEPQFDSVSFFSEGLASISINGKYGFKNKNRILHLNILP